MAQLGAADRNAIILRYFENKNSRDVGAALGINEAAAQKRVARAVEKLRTLCTKRGVVLPAVALVSIISANAVHAAPVAVATTTSVLGGTGLGASTSALVKGTTQLIAWAKYRIAAYTGLGLAIVAGTTFLVTEHSWFQPRYQNRSLAAWLAQLDDGQRDYVVLLHWQPWESEIHLTPQQKEAAQAVRAMGVPAIPFLMSNLKTSDTALNRFIGKFGTPPDAAHREALLALDALGPECKPLIPELTQMLQDDKSAKDAAAILGSIGPDGWQILTKAITSTNDTAVACSVWSLGSRKAAVLGTVEAMENIFANSPETGLTPLTGWALAEIGQDREQVVSLLIKGLSFKRQDSRWGCAVSLGCLGKDAESAVPYLLPMMKDVDPIISHDAAQAIEQIDPKTAARVGATGAMATEHVPKMMFLP